MKVDTQKLINELQSIIDNCDLTEQQEWALIITISHLEDILEEENGND